MSGEERKFTQIRNGGAIPLESLPPWSVPDFISQLGGSLGNGLRVVSYFGTPGAKAGETWLYAVLALDAENKLFAGRTLVTEGGFPSLAVDYPQIQLFEREIAEQFGLVPSGHPWLKPVRYRRSWNGADAWNRPAGAEILPGAGNFFRVEGEEVHEVAVGPVHAGIIEPGHFRFQCHGENVMFLEIALGYQHRGVEEAMLGGPDKRTLHFAETLSGDSTIAHATVYSHLVESLTKTKKNARAQVINGVLLELERLANHTGDIGALAGDAAYLPASSFCGRIRGDFLNMTALVCGSRFGRGAVKPGGVGFDIDEAMRAELLRRLDAAEKDVVNAVNLVWDEQSVVARFEKTGTLTREMALELGVVGPAARAAGLSRDVRYDQPLGIYRMVHVPVSTYDTGDVFARAYVRWMEIRRSVEFIRDQLHSLPEGFRTALPGSIAKHSFAVALVEGWRGEVCHAAVTDGSGTFARYKVVDPSFHNWPALAYVLRGQEISDFPLCNKSFNLSYCGHDL